MCSAYILPSIVVLLFQGGDDVFFRASDTAFGKTFASKLTADALLSSPEWDENSENPPVSARSALKAAREMRDLVITTPEGFEWTRGSLTLMRPSEHCFWLVRFRAASENDDGWHHFTVVVLMDGTALKPVEELPGRQHKKSCRLD